jgi:hypothetical protein
VSGKNDPRKWTYGLDEGALDGVELAVDLGRVGEGGVLSHCDNVVVVGGERWVWVFVKGR